jgi:hypothetical protein
LSALSSEAAEKGVAAAQAPARRSDLARRNWLGLSLLLLLAGLGAGVVLGVRVIADPPAPACTLPSLPIKTARGLVWSTDSQRLLVREESGSLSEIHFPNVRVRHLSSPIPPTIVRPLGWDAADRPLAFIGRWAHGRLHRLSLSGSHWEPTPYTGIAVDVSPDGRRAAVRTSNAWTAFARRPRVDVYPLLTVDRVVVVNLETLTEEAAMPQPPGSTMDLYWPDSRTLAISRSTPGKPLWARGAPWCKHTVGSGTFESATGTPPPVPRRVYAQHSVSPAPFARERAFLRRFDVPGIPHSDPYEAWLVIRDRAGRELRREPLGRVPQSQQGRSSSSAEVSPDGRWVVTSSGDGSVRVLDLHSAPGK